MCLGSPGVHALHDDLVLFALHHVVGEHGVEVGYGRRQDDPVGAELVIPHLPEETDRRHFPSMYLTQNLMYLCPCEGCIELMTTKMTTTADMCRIASLDLMKI